MISSYQIWVIFIFIYQKYLKQSFQTGFWVQNDLLNLFSGAVNSQRLLCSQRAGVKCSCYIFLVYKGYFIVQKLILNVGIKAFWRKKIYYRCELETDHWLISRLSPHYRYRLVHNISSYSLEISNLSVRISIINAHSYISPSLLAVFLLVNYTSPNWPMIIVRPFIQNQRGNFLLMVLYVLYSIEFSLLDIYYSCNYNNFVC